MAVDAEIIRHLTDIFRPLGHITARRMFSGAGIYADGVIFALLIGEDGGSLHFKVDDETRGAFKARGSAPFEYETKNGTTTIDSYWRSPADPFDDPDECLAFARMALAAARRKAAAAAKKKPKAVKTPKAKKRRRPSA